MLSAFLHGRVPGGRPCVRPGLPWTPSAVCGDLWRIYGLGSQTQPKPTTERSSLAGDACDPPGPLLARDGRRPGSSLDGAAERRPSVRADEATANRTQLSVDHTTPLRNLVSVGRAFTEIEQLSAVQELKLEPREPRKDEPAQHPWTNHWHTAQRSHPQAQTRRQDAAVDAPSLSPACS